jgi:hypothetical protein
MSTDKISRQHTFVVLMALRCEFIGVKGVITTRKGNKGISAANWRRIHAVICLFNWRYETTMMNFLKMLEEKEKEEPK